MVRSPRKRTASGRHRSPTPELPNRANAVASTSESTAHALPFEVLSIIGEYVHLLDLQTADLAVQGNRLVFDGFEPLVEEEAAFQKEAHGIDVPLSPWLTAMLAFVDTGGETNLRKTKAALSATAPRLRLVSRLFDNVMKPIIFRVRPLSLGLVTTFLTGRYLQKRTLTGSALTVERIPEHLLSCTRQLVVRCMPTGGSLASPRGLGGLFAQIDQYHAAVASVLSKVPLHLLVEAKVYAMQVQPGRPTRTGTRATLTKPTADMLATTLCAATRLEALEVRGLSEPSLAGLLANTPRLRTLQIHDVSFEPNLYTDEILFGTLLRSTLSSLSHLQMLHISCDHLLIMWLQSASAFSSLNITELSLLGATPPTEQIIFAAQAFGSSLLHLGVRCNSLRLLTEGLATPRVEEVLSRFSKLHTFHLGMLGSWTGDFVRFLSFPSFPTTVRVLRLEWRLYDMDTLIWMATVDLVPELAAKGVKLLELTAAMGVKADARKRMRQQCADCGIVCRLS